MSQAVQDCESDNGVGRMTWRELTVTLLLSALGPSTSPTIRLRSYWYPCQYTRIALHASRSWSNASFLTSCRLSHRGDGHLTLSPWSLPLKDHLRFVLVSIIELTVARPQPRWSLNVQKLFLIHTPSYCIFLSSLVYISVEPGISFSPTLHLILAQHQLWQLRLVHQWVSRMPWKH